MTEDAPEQAAPSRSSLAAAAAQPPAADNGPVAVIHATNGRRRRPGVVRLAGVAAGVVGLLAGSVFAVSMLRAGSGAASPEGAVRDLLAAVADGDAIGVADSLVPAERSLLLDDAVPVFDDLRRVGALGSRTSLRDVGAGGYRGELRGLRLGVRRPQRDRALVQLVGGTFTTSVDVAKLPFGSSLRDRNGALLGRTGSQRRTIDLARSAGGRPIVVERVGGRWGVSLARTALHRWAAGAPAGGAVVPVGADSPEAAVRLWFDGIRRLDAERVLAVLAPGEVGVVQDAAGRFLPAIQERLAQLDGQYRFELPGLRLDPSTRGDRSVVRVERLDVDIELAQPDAPVLQMESASGCMTVRLGDQVHRRCGNELPRLLGDLGLPVEPATLDAIVPTSARPVGWAVVAVREQGRWYVSPGRTLLHDLHLRLAGLTPTAFKRQADAIAKVVAGTTIDWSAGIFVEI